MRLSSDSFAAGMISPGSHDARRPVGLADTGGGALDPMDWSDLDSELDAWRGRRSARNAVVA